MPTIETARAWYPEFDPVHGFDHVLRVYKLAERLAAAEGADMEIVRAAALLHDAQGESGTGEDRSVPGDSEFLAEKGSNLSDSGRGDHQNLSARFARGVLEAEGWEEGRIAAVEHCIRAHRFRKTEEQPGTIEAQVLFDADKLDAIGAIGVARAVAYAAREGKQFYWPPSDHFLTSGEEEAGEPHSAYHEYLFKLRKLKDRLYTPYGRLLALERHERMVSFFEQLAIEVDGKDWPA
jgi:uncharacterized protein